MTRETDPLPDPPDLDAAKRLNATLHQQLLSSQREIASLRHKLDVLCRRLFGKKSEKVDPRQLALALEQLRNEGGGEGSDPREMDSGEPVQWRERVRTRKAPRGRRWRWWRRCGPSTPARAATRES